LTCDMPIHRLACRTTNKRVQRSPMAAKTSATKEKETATSSDGRRQRSEPGDGDIRRLLRLIESNLLQADDPDADWHDEGWLLLWHALLLVLYGFRRGWVLR